MIQQELEIIIENGEGYKTEFKESFRSGLVKELVAFANASGGKILLGVKDNGDIKGIVINNDLKSKIQDGTINGTINDSVNNTISDAVKKRLSQEIYFLYKKDGSTIQQIIYELAISRRTILRDISILKEANLVIFYGARKTGKYILSELMKERIKNSER